MTCQFCQDTIPAYLCPECSSIDHVNRGKEIEDEIEAWGSLYWWNMAKYLMDKYINENQGMSGLQEKSTTRLRGTHVAEGEKAS